MKRRSFISTLIGSTTLSLAALSQTNDGKSSVTTNSSEPATKHVDISVFMTDAVKDATSKDTNPYFATQLVGKALDNAFTSIPTENETLTTTIRTETTVINEAALDPDSENPVHNWEHNLTDLVPESEIATDTNLLLTSQSADIAGQGHFPCTDSECGKTDHTTAIVMDADEHISNLTMDSVSGPWDLTTSEYILQVAVHETGHTVGLTHGHGTGERDDSVEVTPMLGTYIFNDDYSGSENHYNDQLPELDGDETVVSQATFNDKITLEAIETTHNTPNNETPIDAH